MAPPEKVDRYEIQGEIDRGGMATVFKAYDPRFQRTVAVKLLPQQMMHDPEFRERFTREARTIARLEHPAIVPVYDFGEENGQPYLVMRLMLGGSLQHRLDKGPLSVDEAAVILQRLGSALDTAHSKGIIHRDLKPSNVLFDQYGESYLADFGIAHVSSSEANLTASGSLVGTPTYMSPEQVYGDKTLDGRSDIYALGVILFQMLTGHTPYDADTPARVMMKHVMDPVPAISTERPDLPPEMDAIITKAMAKERDERYATASDLTSDITHATQKTTQPDLAADLAALQADIAPEIAESEPAEPETVSPPPRRKKEVIGIGTTSDDYYQTQTSSGKIPVWIWAVVALVLLVCVGGTIGVGVLIFNAASEGDGGLLGTDSEATAVALDDEAVTQTRAAEIATRAAFVAESTTNEPETAVPENTPMPTENPEETEVTVDANTAIEQTRESAAATRDASATEGNGSDSVEQTRESIIATRDAAAEADGSTRDNVALPNPFENPTLRADFGPESGELEHEDDDIIELIYADNSPQNFVVSADIGNPYSADKGGWDFGIIFRQEEVDEELRLVIRSDGEWNLNNRAADDDQFLQDGDVYDLLELAEDGGNQITLIALDDTGYFILNGEFVAELDISERPSAGNIALGTGFYAANEQEGFATSYENFSVWEVEPEFGPETGELEHILDDLIKLEKTDVNLTNFIATANFLNPFSADESDWDLGYGFRVDEDQYWLVIESTGDWTLVERYDSDADTDEDTAFGEVDNLDTDADGSNEVTLIAVGETGYLVVNDEFVDAFDLSNIPEAGDVEIVTAFYFDHEIEGNATGYEDFTVWPLP